MTPEEIRQKLAEVDAQLADALRKSGLTEAEIASVLAPGLPAEI